MVGENCQRASANRFVQVLQRITGQADLVFALAAALRAQLLSLAIDLLQVELGYLGGSSR